MITQIKKIRLHRLYYTVIVGILFMISLVVAGQAQEEKGKIKTTTVAKEVQGEISGISKDFIAVVYEKDAKKGIEYEILLPIGKDIRLVHKRSLEQLNVGDIVRIQYEEVTEEYKEGPRSSRKAKVISFVKPAVKKPETPEPVEVEEGELPIKGIKGE